MIGKYYKQKVPTVRYKLAQTMAAPTNSIDILHMAHNMLSLQDTGNDLDLR